MISLTTDNPIIKQLKLLLFFNKHLNAVQNWISKVTLNNKKIKHKFFETHLH